MGEPSNESGGPASVPAPGMEFFSSHSHDMNFPEENCNLNHPFILILHNKS